MVFSLFIPIENAMFDLFGSFTYIAIAICLFFIVMLIWRGLDFRYCLLLLAPCIARLSDGSWLPVWVGFMMWFIVIGFGLYLGWKTISY
jgi:hypothetical protein